MQSSSKRKSILGQATRWFSSALLIAVVLVGVVFLIGLVPINNDFEQPEEGLEKGSDGSIELFIVSTAVHADIIMPRANSIVDWDQEFASAQIAGNVDSATHVAVGWGDKGFFLETPTWKDLKASTAFNALFRPSASCVHMAYTRPDLYADTASVRVSVEQYRDLVNFVKNSLIRDDDGQFVPIVGFGYGTTDAFFNAKGSYHLFNTCNSWVGRGLGAAGVRVPWLTPLPKTPMLYLDDS